MFFYEGPDISSTELGRFCGREAPEDPIMSPSNYMTVRFRTDNSITQTGFNATYQQGKIGSV